MNQHEVPCPLCGNREYRVLYRPWRDVTDPVKLFGAASGERGTQQIVRCRTPGCGMIFASPRYDDAVIFRGYTEASDDGHDSQFDSRVQTFLRSLRKHAVHLPPPGSKALDVGCAGGAYLKAADLFGYEAQGLEPSRLLVESCRHRGLRATCGTLDTWTAPERYDLVSLWDVIEHVTDPRKVLRQVRPLIKPGGVLLVNYPDAGTWQAKVAGRSFWWFLSVHLYYFDRHTVRLLLEKEGFEAISIRRHIQVLELGYLVDVARIYSPPLASLGARLIPSFLKKRHIPYYASQTTVLARPGAR